MRVFVPWFKKARRVMRLSPSERLLACMCTESQLATKEDVNRHKHQVEPGDHLRNLSAETVAKLDRILEPVLAKIGYDHG